MMKSIEKLRELAADINSTEILDHMEVSGKFLFHTDWLHSWHDAFDAGCDEIEREVADRYMLLPVDADGVPIHCGERMRLDNGHEGDVWLIGVFDIMMSDHTCFDWAKSRHVKPRTLEDVLAEYRLEADRLFCDPSIGGEDRADALESLDAKYAAEIRKLMGASERVMRNE